MEYGECNICEKTSFYDALNKPRKGKLSVFHFSWNWRQTPTRLYLIASLFVGQKIWQSITYNNYANQVLGLLIL